MELPAPPSLEDDNVSAPPSESPTAAETSGQEWYDIEFTQHRNYLDRWSNGAVTEGAYTRAPFGYLLTGQRFISDETSTKWTDADKLAFFGSLARHSRWQPDLIAQDIGGSKTQAQVVQYIEALERERRILKVFQRPRKTHLRKQGWMSGLAPAAREVASARIEWEESMTERLEMKEAKQEEEAARSDMRTSQITALEQVFNAHRKEAVKMEKTLDKDLEAMRPKRFEILKRAKTGLEVAVESAKADYAAVIVEKVLRTCDENGLKVLDVLVKQAAERAEGIAPKAQVVNPDGTTAAQPESAGTTHRPSATQTLPPPPPIESFSSRQRAVSAEMERLDQERYAYLSRFPVRKLSEKHKAEKQMLAKRMRMREKRREKRAAASTSGEQIVSGNVSREGANAPVPRHENRRESGNLPITSAETTATSGSATNDSAPIVVPSTLPMSELQSVPVTPLDLTSHRTHRKDTLEKHASRIQQEQYEKARVDYLSRIPLADLTEEQRHEKKLLTGRIRAREKYRAKAAAKVGIKIEEQLGVEVVDAPSADIRLVILHEKKRKRDKMEDGASDAGSELGGNGTKSERQAERLERYKAEEEEYERLLALSQSRKPLSEEQKQRKNKLRIRIKSREWRRARSAKVLTVGLNGADDIKPIPIGQGNQSVDGKEKDSDGLDATAAASQSTTNQSRPASSVTIGSVPTQLSKPTNPRRYMTQRHKEERESQKLRRYRDERKEYRRLRALSHSENALSPEDKLKFRKLGRRIACRKWKRRQAAVKNSTGLDEDRNNIDQVGAGTEPVANGSQVQKETTLRKDGDSTDPVASRPSEESSTQHKGLSPGGEQEGAKRTQLSASTRASSSSTKRRRGDNQYDKDGIGKTRFLQELRSYHDDIIADLLAWVDAFDGDFEGEFRLFLRMDAKSVAEVLPQFEYAPQLLTFVRTRRLELLDLPGIANLLKHAKGEEAHTVDLTQLLASFETISSLIRNTLKICIELNSDSRRNESTSTPIDHDTIVVGLSLLGQNVQSQQEKGDEGSEPTVEFAQPRIPDAEWVDMVDPTDGLFEEDPLAEGDADAEAEDARLLEVEQQQAFLDDVEDQEYEFRIACAIRQPGTVVMGDAALPMLENDTFDWMMYEQGKDGKWRKLQYQAREQSMPTTWAGGHQENPVQIATEVVERRRAEQIVMLRDNLRKTIYEHDRLRWQRIKRLRDPMYHRGSVKQFFSTHKSAEYIASSDDDGSETEIEEEDELMDSDEPHNSPGSGAGDTAEVVDDSAHDA